MNVELIGWYGGDKAIARTAWTSTQIEIESKTPEQIRDLIVNKLWNNGTGKPHKTPFERGIVEFNITCDQASHIHLLKHRMANINGESARYKELKEDKTYLPKDWESIVSSQPIYLDGECIAESGERWIDILDNFSRTSNKLYHQCLEDLTRELGRKRAKESARFFKTMNSKLTLSVMMNMSCFYNFVTLRNDESAQEEIQMISQMMVSEVKSIEGDPFKYTIEAFNF